MKTEKGYGRCHSVNESPPPGSRSLLLASLGTGVRARARELPAHERRA